MTILLLLGLGILINKRHNRYTFIFVSKLAVIDFFIMLLIFFIIKIGNFSSMLMWESSIYFWLSKIKVNYYLLFDMYIGGLSAYMIISLAAAAEMYSGKHKGAFTALSIPALIFLYLNQYNTSMELHFFVLSGKSGLLSIIAEHINVFNAVVIIFYLLLPYAVIVSETVRTKIKYKKRYAGALGLCMLIIDIIVCAVLWISPYDMLIFYAPEFLRSPRNLHMHFNQNYLMYLIAGMMLLGIFTYFAAARKIFDNINLSAVYVHTKPKKSTIYFNDARPVFHTYKNILLSIDLMAKNMESKCPPKDIEDGLHELRSVVNESVNQMVHLLDIYNDPSEIVESTDLVECINNAAKKSVLPPDIKVEINAPPDGVTVSTDEVLLEEVFANLIKNSVEAIAQTQRDGKITVNILTEGNWSCTYFSDNGCGIAKKDYKNIFRPLYSTKKTRKNWGIGLSFVSNVILSLGGKITVSSKCGEYTEFEILLPIERKNNV